MKIARITVGVIEAGAPVVRQVEPHADGLTIVPTGALAAEAVAAAVRHAMSRPEPRSAELIPFVRIALTSGELELEVADDAVQAMRMLTEGRRGALPLVMEAGAGDDEELEALLVRISSAAGLDEVEQLGPALSLQAASVEREATAEELAYVEAQRRATQAAAAVRRIDDQMTASVVPDWIWVATAFGGLGVLLTAIVFLHPETRIFLIPALLALSIVGFALYGWRSWKELRVRGQLQNERAELRERREAARKEARERGAKLTASGRDPDELVLRMQGIVIGESVPAVLVRDAGTLADLASPSRQTIVFVDGAIDHERVRDLTRLEKIG